jgi:hypothetical protein
MTATLNDGAYYDPETDSWETIPTDGAPAGGTSRPLHWIGDRLVVHPGGAGGVYTPGEGWQNLEALVGVPTPHKLLIDGDRILFTRGLSIWMLDVASASWLDVPEPTGAVALENDPDFFDVAWSGSTLLLWGSSVPQTCVAPPGVDGCDLANLTLPAGEGVMVRLE